MQTTNLLSFSVWLNEKQLSKPHNYKYFGNANNMFLREAAKLLKEGKTGSLTLRMGNRILKLANINSHFGFPVYD